jgi:hypothetical protein
MIQSVETWKLCNSLEGKEEEASSEYLDVCICDDDDEEVVVDCCNL